MVHHHMLTKNFVVLNGDFLFRAWVLVNSKGIYQNQISIPKLALVQPSYEGGRYLCLNAPGMPTLKLDIHMKDNDDKEKRMVKYVSGLRSTGIIFVVLMIIYIDHHINCHNEIY